MLILSLDVPGRRLGGWVLYDTATQTTSFGDITFNPEGAEADDYRALINLLNTYRPDRVILEHAFLYSIQCWVAAAKTWCAMHHIPWVQYGASKAKKAVLNHGRASKDEVLIWAQDLLPEIQTQHQADSLLYLHTYLKGEAE